MEEIAMKIIANAGAARSKAFEALTEAKRGNFAKAMELLETSDKYAREAHKAHSTLLTMYANGEFDQSDVLISHAQDHLMCAELAKELISEIIELRKDTERR
ncbi:MAG: PTS lactose/cellobiose transporter subunit IIA [Chloroflexi bacterium]|nr:PTS lactose/cellobiose transporter subunit IIA [Chloroflexota bacterium]